MFACCLRGQFLSARVDDKTKRAVLGIYLSTSGHYPDNCQLFPARIEFVLIECKRLSKAYASNSHLVKAVDDVNFSILKGEFVVILGHSGSGKTTLLSLIGGLTRPDTGTVLVDGKDNWQNGDKQLSIVRNRTIGFIFQFASLIPTLTAVENVLFPTSFGSSSPGGLARAEELLDKVGLAEKRHAFPGQLSGGQQRRIAIARAFINSPAIILADEPTGDLDEETEGEILQFFRNYNESGTTFLVVTHNKELAQSQRHSRVMSMKNGCLKEGEGDEAGS